MIIVEGFLGYLFSGEDISCLMVWFGFLPAPVLG